MKRLIFILSLVVIALAACDSNNPSTPRRGFRNRSLLVPSSSGNPYEVMVVAEDSVWDGYPGRALDVVLNKEIPMLPRPAESVFHVSRITPDHFNRISNLFRNIIVLKVNPRTTAPKMSFERDAFSSPQLIITIQGPDERDLSMYITEHTQTIIQFISSEEINRNAELLESQYNKDFYDKAKEMFDCELFIPVDVRKMKIGDNFIWASNDGINSIQNICIYSYPYVSTKELTRKGFISLRDTFMRRNIPGGQPNQYMTTNHEFVQTKAINVQGRYVMEARGLWRVENDIMGGPFISHSEIDTVNNRIIVVEGFVYAPDKMKRTMLRRLEAALYTLRLPVAKQTNTNE